jgi:L-iditol 2-dehydrogenase
MKAMQLTGIRQMEMHEVPNPKIVNTTDVLIRLKSVGVCGSDVHYYDTGQIGSQVVEYPFTVGHECAGLVERIGAAVTNVEVGDRVAVEPAMSCHECDQCRSGRSHTCRKLRFLGCPGQAEGCLSEFVVMPQECCFKIPHSMSYEQAALSEPLSIGVYAGKLSGNLQAKNIGILGAGPIGLSVLMPAKTQGAKKVYMTDKIQARLDMAGKAGADWTGNPDEMDIVAEIANREPELLDIVFECCGQQDAVNQAIDLLKPGGKLMIIGIPPTLENWALPVDKMRRKELCIQNVRRQNHCVQPALDMIETGEVKVDSMLTHRFDFNETQAAFDLVSGYSDAVIKAVVNFS